MSNIESSDEKLRGLAGAGEGEAHDEGASLAQTGHEGQLSDKLVLDFLIVVLGFGLCRAWIVFCLGVPLVAPTAFPSHWMYLASGAVCSLAVAVACRPLGSRLAAVRRLLFRATPCALVASGILILVALYGKSEVALAAGFIVGGVGAGPLQVLWGDRFARHSVEFAAFASPAAAVVTAVMVALSTGQTNFVGFIVVPLISFLLLVFHAHRTGLSWKSMLATESTDTTGADAGLSAETTDASTTTGAPARSVPLGVGKLMFSIMVFSLLCRMFDAMPAGHDPLAPVGGSAVFSLIVVGIVFLAIVAKVRRRFDPSSIYRLSLPIMVAGYVAIALFFDTHAAASILIINVGYEFFDILTWILFVDAARRPNENALRIFGLGVAFMFTGMALGNAASHLIDSLVTSGSVQANVVAMAAILGLVIVAFLVLPEGAVSQLSSSLREGKREKGADATAETPGTEGAEPAEGRIEQQCALVARDYGLTPRESEVIVLLAYGRTLAIIARDLHIAQGTARTHIENIYRKLDVHKQQELIDLVESHKAS